MNKNDMYEIKVSDDDEPKHKSNSDNNVLTEPINDDGSEKKESEGSEESRYLDQLQRLQAEFVNYKKRVEKEKLELSDYFKSELVGSLLPVIDDFERMLDHTNDEDNEFQKGVKLIYQKFIDILKEQGLKPIECVGQKFDPSLHEAVLIENSENGEDEIVAEEWRKGYKFNNRLLRPAQVKVLKAEKLNKN